MKKSKMKLANLLSKINLLKIQVKNKRMIKIYLKRSRNKRKNRQRRQSTKKQTIKKQISKQMLQIVKVSRTKCKKSLLIQQMKLMRRKRRINRIQSIQTKVNNHQSKLMPPSKLTIPNCNRNNQILPSNRLKISNLNRNQTKQIKSMTKTKSCPKQL